MHRSAGILMPITSLPSPYGVGTMGASAREFIDFLEKAGQSYWQILPLGPTGYGDSPYQSFSSFAGNPYLIDLDDLNEEGYLNKEDYADINWGENPLRTDYGLLYKNRFRVLRKACVALHDHLPDDYESFKEENPWLRDYALFMALKTKFGGVSWQDWPDEVRHRDQKVLSDAETQLKEEILFWTDVQYLFFHQWKKLYTYAHAHGISIIGDVPIYVSPDSADIWANQKEFQLDKNGKPTEVAGCPPDGFAADGQLWGNPLYNWEYMATDHYSWWTKRIAHQFKLVDVLRIDHFRGFEGYYAIPAGEKTARNGRWRKGPGISFFKEIEKQLGHLNIIAEDLGYLTPEVIQMVKDTGYPGMKVLQFAFDVRDTGSGYLPHTYYPNCVVYAGTHDNDTVNGWMKTAPKESTERAKEYLNLSEKEGYNWGFLRGAYESVANLAVMQFQDILGLGSEGRMNIPSTTGNNWTWRTGKGTFDPILAQKLYRWMDLYGRLPVKKIIADNCGRR